MNTALSYTSSANSADLQDNIANTQSVVISKITLSNYRSYSRLRLNAKPGLSIITGANGAGKTNFLEALSLLSAGRGLRQARFSEIASQISNSSNVLNTKNKINHWGVAADVSTPKGAISIGIGWKAGNTDRREIKVNGSLGISQTELSKYVPMVWLTPAMDRLFAEPAAARRRFLDRLVFAFDPSHAGRLQAYERARRERKIIFYENPRHTSWISALERTMVERGVAIAAARLDLIERLKESIDKGSSAFPKPEILIEGKVEDWLKNHPALEVEERYQNMLTQSRKKDAETGNCEGIHRSDLIARLNIGGLSAQFASTGEQKAILIAIIFAHSRLLTCLKGAIPVLLLDEITAHLDSVRRDALFEELYELGAQAWLTGTDKSLFSTMSGKSKFYSVVNGLISEHGDND